MRKNNIHGEGWNEVENMLRRRWLNTNNNLSLTWEDVKDSVRLGWTMSRIEDGQHESIH